MKPYVLLVFPALSHNYGKPDRPPLGIMTIAGALLNSKIDVAVLDERAEGAGFTAELLSELKNSLAYLHQNSMKPLAPKAIPPHFLNFYLVSLISTFRDNAPPTKRVKFSNF